MSRLQRTTGQPISTVATRGRLERHGPALRCFCALEPRPVLPPRIIPTEQRRSAKELSPRIRPQAYTLQRLSTRQPHGFFLCNSHNHRRRELCRQRFFGGDSEATSTAYFNLSPWGFGESPVLFLSPASSTAWLSFFGLNSDISLLRQIRPSN